MHEFSLAQSLVEQVTELVVREGATKVTRIEVSIGAMSGVMKDPFEFCFPEAARGTRMEGCILIVHEVPLTVTCLECGAETSSEIFDIRCGLCKCQNVKITGGKDFLLNSVEVD
ncbi:MAG: hydrogenase maturation nickel metallochaperone HypA [Gammaproteobacteria bacterium]|nr:hydrogenase maturation nickel metallochaperone HypA [Gammaproteobacteria bacterium]